MGFITRLRQSLAAAIAPSGPQMSETRPRSASNSRRASILPQISEGPNALAYQDLETIRKRSRGAEINNPHAEAIIESWVTDAVGVGVTPVFKHPNKELAEELRKHWRNWDRKCDFDGRFNFAGRLGAVVQAMVRDGEALVRRRTIKKRGIVALELEQIEADHLVMDLTAPESAGGNRVHMGIEFAPNGKRVAYHLYKQHPEETYGLGAGFTRETERIPADQIIHAQRPRRPKETRSLPWMTPIIPRLAMLDYYDDAVMTRTAIASTPTGFIKGAAENDPIIPPKEGESLTAVDGRFDGELEIGSFPELGVGEEVQFPDLPDMGVGYEGFVARQLKSIAVGAGRTSWSVDGNYAEVNYTSIRAGQNNVQRRVEAFQWNALIPQVCETVLEWFMTTGVLDGTFSPQLMLAYLNSPLDFEVEWVTHGFPWVDPLKESLAATNDVKHGFNSRRRVVAARGDQVEDIDREIAEDARRAEDLNIQIGDPKEAKATPPNGKKIEAPVQEIVAGIAKEILQ